MGKIQVHKINSKGFNGSLVDQARFVFNIAKTNAIRANDHRFDASIRLNRKQLRALNRAGYVKRFLVFDKRKYTDTAPAMHYIYEWMGSKLGEKNGKKE